MAPVKGKPLHLENEAAKEYTCQCHHRWNATINWEKNTELLKRIHDKVKEALPLLPVKGQILSFNGFYMPFTLVHTNIPSICSSAPLSYPPLSYVR